MPMQETRVHFRAGRVELEGRLHPADGTRAAVITHPHPLYGGDMTSPVVEAAALAYQRCGFATLRFNFRGTGRSGGSHDQGRGEQDDVRAAMDYLHTRRFETIHLAGYSFGAWVNALAMDTGLEVTAATMVAPPVAFIEFPAEIRLPRLIAVIAGSEDEFGPPALIETQMKQWHPTARFDVIHGADHFFFGFLDEITRLLQDTLKTV